MKIWQRLKNSGYRFRVYLFAGLLVFLVLASLVFAFGVSWHSKRLLALVVEKDFKARETERTLVDLLVSMDQNRKKSFLLEKPEYGRLFREDSLSFRRHLARLEELGLSEQEKADLVLLRDRFEDYLLKDPFVAADSPSTIESVSDLPLEEVRLRIGRLLERNQERMDLRILEMNRLEHRVFQAVLVGAVASLLAAGLLSFLLIRSITRPIDLLRKGTHKIAEGEFMHRVDLATKGELGDLADSFNEMARQLKKLDEMKADFMALVSHELKTPLTSMKEAVGLMLEEAVGPISPKQRRLLRIHAAGIEKLTGFVEDILNLTTMEGGLTPLYSTSFDMRGLLQRQIDIFRLLADKKQIRLSATYRPNPFPPVHGDAERLKQVFANLLNNAIFFTPPGGEVAVRVESVLGKYLPERFGEGLKVEASKPYVKIEVVDTGEGIPREEWNRVFDKFYQIQRSSNRGSGLGLTIAKHIVEAHGGGICVGASSEEGTTFVFVIPQGEAPREQTVREEAGTARVQSQNPEGVYFA
jgi:signal transduction histidine kinase